MKTYYETDFGIDTGEFFVPKHHPQYSVLLKEIESNEAVLINLPTPKPTPAPTPTPFPSPTSTITWEMARAKRNRLLRDSDWTMLSDINLSNKEEWVKYRHHLRMLPQFYKNPARIVWPESPKTN